MRRWILERGARVYIRVARVYDGRLDGRLRAPADGALRVSASPAVAGSRVALRRRVTVTARRRALPVSRGRSQWLAVAAAAALAVSLNQVSSLRLPRALPVSLGRSGSATQSRATANGGTGPSQAGPEALPVWHRRPAGAAGRAGAAPDPSRIPPASHGSLTDDLTHSHRRGGPPAVRVPRVTVRGLTLVPALAVAALAR